MNTVSNLANQGINALSNKVGLSDTAKDMLIGLKDKAIGHIQSSFGKPSIPRSTGDKPSVPTATHEKPSLSGWDKFKNFFANVWNKTGGALTGKEAHIIKPEDYVKDEKTGQNKFDWNQANKNYEQEHGKKRGEWDVGKIISTGAKVASMM